MGHQWCLGVTVNVCWSSTQNPSGPIHWTPFNPGTGSSATRCTAEGIAEGIAEGVEAGEAHEAGGDAHAACPHGQGYLLVNTDVLHGVMHGRQLGRG